MIFLKRFVSFFLLFVTIFFSAFSASAASNDLGLGDSWVNVLDLCTPNDAGSNMVWSKGNPTSVRFTYPDTIICYGFDGVVQANAPFTASIVLDSGTVRPLVVTPIGSGYYRITGGSDGQTLNTFSIRFDSTSQYFNFISLRMQKLYKAGVFPTVGRVDAHWQNGSGGFVEKSALMSAPNQVAKVVAVLPKLDYTVSSYYKAYFTAPDWKKYDYLDFNISIRAEEVSSIQCVQNSSFLPIEIMSVVPSLDTSGHRYYDYIVRVDLRGVDRRINNSPVLSFSGYFPPSSKSLSQPDMYISVLSVTGYIASDSPDPLLSSIARILDSVKSGFSALSDKISSFMSAVGRGFSNVLSKLEALPARIAEELSKLFKPDSGKIDSSVQDAQNVAQEQLGGLYEGAELVDSIADAFKPPAIPISSVQFPSVTLDFSGVPFKFGGWVVPVVPTGFDFLMDAVKLVNNLIFTIGFVMVLKKRLEGVFS